MIRATGIVLATVLTFLQGYYFGLIGVFASLITGIVICYILSSFYLKGGE